MRVRALYAWSLVQPRVVTRGKAGFGQQQIKQNLVLLIGVCQGRLGRCFFFCFCSCDGSPPKCLTFPLPFPSTETGMHERTWFWHDGDEGRVAMASPPKTSPLIFAHSPIARPPLAPQYRSSRSHGATPTPFVLTAIGTGILVLPPLLVGRGDLGTGEIRSAGAVSFQRRLGSLQDTRANQRGWAPRKGTVGHSREEGASTSAGNGQLYMGGKEGYKTRNVLHR